MFYEAAEARKDHPVIIEPLSGVPVFDDRGHDHDLHDQSKTSRLVMKSWLMRPAKPISREPVFAHSTLSTKQHFSSWGLLTSQWPATQLRTSFGKYVKQDCQGSCFTRAAENIPVKIERYIEPVIQTSFWKICSLLMQAVWPSHKSRAGVTILFLTTTVISALHSLYSVTNFSDGA